MGAGSSPWLIGSGVCGDYAQAGAPTAKTRKWAEMCGIAGTGHHIARARNVTVAGSYHPWPRLVTRLMETAIRTVPKKYDRRACRRALRRSSLLLGSTSGAA